MCVCVRVCGGKCGCVAERPRECGERRGRGEQRFYGGRSDEASTTDVTLKKSGKFESSKVRAGAFVHWAVAAQRLCPASCIPVSLHRRGPSCASQTEVRLYSRPPFRLRLGPARSEPEPSDVRSRRERQFGPNPPAQPLLCPSRSAHIPAQSRRTRPYAAQPHT